MSDVVQKLWGFCHTLRHDGIDYGDYIEQITYLLFLKMADERGVELPKGMRLGQPDREEPAPTSPTTNRGSAPQARASSRASSATSSPGPSPASATRSTSRSWSA